jgi:epoxyqueuosine reductase
VRIPFPWEQSAVVCFASYRFPDAPLSTQAAKRGSAWIARYAWSSRVLPGRKGANGERRPSDYHKVLLKRLREVEARLHKQFGAFESRAYVDTGPVVERALAVAAGLGWTGKNTCLIHPQLGSFGFLAVLLTSLKVSEPASRRVGESAAGVNPKSAEEQPQILRLRLPQQTRQTPLWMTDRLLSGIPAQHTGALAAAGSSFEIPDRCGTCRRCIEACPTHALDAPYRMDARRCISYLTIEHKGPIDEELMAGMGRQVFGCDICQDVCPWNGKALRGVPIPVDPELEPRAELVNPALEWLGSLDEKSFEQIFNGSPVRRAGFLGLRRNVAIAMGNSGIADFMPRLEEWAKAADEGLRAAARWALRRLREETSA